MAGIREESAPSTNHKQLLMVLKSADSNRMCLDYCNLDDLVSSYKSRYAARCVDKYLPKDLGTMD